MLQMALRNYERPDAERCVEIIDRSRQEVPPARKAMLLGLKIKRSDLSGQTQKRGLQLIRGHCQCTSSAASGFRVFM
jgi:hypothetical protein